MNPVGMAESIIREPRVLVADDDQSPAVKPVILVITAYADQKFKEVDPSVVAGVLRKPFEVADLGDIVKLCAAGLNRELTQRQYYSRSDAIRDFEL